jgi:hypothetical protein
VKSSLQKMDTLDVMMKKYISEQQADLYNG